MTRTQNSQKLRKTMIHFFLFHICLSWSPVSHCLSCSVIIIKTAKKNKKLKKKLLFFFFALKFLLCACFNEKLSITWNPITSLSTSLEHWPLQAARKPHSDFHNLALHKQEKGHNETTIHLLTHQTDTSGILSDWDPKVNENCLPCHSVAERKGHDYSGVYLGK